MTDVSQFTRKRPAQRRAQRTMDDILEAAAQLLDEVSFERLTTNRVAERAGYSIGTLYHYFPDKGSLVRALALREIALAEAGLMEELATCGEDSEAAVRLFIRRGMAPFSGRMNIRRRVFEAIGFDPTIQPELAAALNRLTDELLGAIGYHHISGERRFMLLHAVLGPIRAAALNSPELLTSVAFEDELVGTLMTLLRSEVTRS